MKVISNKTTKPIYVASCSFGKDSIATILLALKHNEPLVGNKYTIVRTFEEAVEVVRNYLQV